MTRRTANMLLAAATGLGVLDGCLLLIAPVELDAQPWVRGLAAMCFAAAAAATWLQGRT